MDGVGTAIGVIKKVYEAYQYAQTVLAASGERRVAYDQVNYALKSLQIVQTIGQELNSGTRKYTPILEPLIQKTSTEDVDAAWEIFEEGGTLKPSLTARIKPWFHRKHGATTAEKPNEPGKDSDQQEVDGIAATVKTAEEHWHAHVEQTTSLAHGRHVLHRRRAQRESSEPVSAAKDDAPPRYVPGPLVQNVLAGAQQLEQQVANTNTKDRLLWTHDSSGVTTSLRRILDQVHLISNTLTRLDFDDARIRAEKLQGGVDDLREDKDREHLITWLRRRRDHGADPADDHRDDLFPWLDATAESEEFTAWLEQSSWWLYLYGRPGAGKTVLCSQIISHLRQRYAGDALVLGLFLDGERPPTDMADLLCSLVLQVVRMTDATTRPQRLAQMLAVGRRHDQLPQREDLQEVLQGLLVDQRLFIILDGLNNYQSSILRDFNRLLRRWSRKGTLNVLVATRISRFDLAPKRLRCNHCQRGELKIYTSCLTCETHSCPTCIAGGLSCTNSEHETSVPHTVEKLVQPDDEILSAYVRWRMKKLCETDDTTLLNETEAPDLDQSALALALAKRPQLSDEIPDAVTQTALGNFRRARTLCDDVLLQSDTQGIVWACKELPEALPDEYQRLMQEINKLTPRRRREKTKDAIYWAAVSKVEQLDFDALNHAINMELDDISYCKDDWLGLPVLLVNAQGLLRVDADKMMSIDNQMEEWIQGQGRVHFAGKDVEVALKLLACLNADEMRTPCEGDEVPAEVAARLERLPLLRFACRRWMDHVSPVMHDEAVYTALLTFLEDADRVAAWAQIRFLHDPCDVELDVRSDLNGLHLAALFGYDRIVIDLLKSGMDVDSRDPGYEQTALMYACRQGHDSIVRLLLDHGAVPDRWSRRGGHALFYAYKDLASSGASRRTIVEMLLNHPQVDVNVHNKRDLNKTMLMLAAWEGDEQILQILLARPNIKVNARDSEGSTALMYAVRKQRASAVKLLLSHPHCKVHVVNRQGDTALSKAAVLRSTNMAKLLIDADLQGFRDQPEYYNAAFSKAVAVRKVQMIELFLDYGFLPHIQNHDGSSLLHQAAYQPDATIAQLLINAGADVNVRDAHSATPLHCASRLGHDEVVQAFLQAGANCHLQDNCNQTPFDVAQESYGSPTYDTLVETLHQAQTTDPNIPQPSPPLFSHLSLHTLITHQHASEFYTRLKTVTPDASHTDPFTGNTPLHTAVQSNDLDMLIALLQAGWPQLATNNRGLTPLCLAIISNQSDHVDELLKYGPVPLDICDKQGMDPLQLAQVKGKHFVAINLIAAGARIGPQHYHLMKRTFAQAVELLEVNVVGKLLAAGADPLGFTRSRVDDRQLCSPLQIALQTTERDYQNEVVKLLMRQPTVYAGFQPAEFIVMEGDDERHEGELEAVNWRWAWIDGDWWVTWIGRWRGYRPVAWLWRGYLIKE